MCVNRDQNPATGLFSLIINDKMRSTVFGRSWDMAHKACLLAFFFFFFFFLSCPTNRAQAQWTTGSIPFPPRSKPPPVGYSTLDGVHKRMIAVAMSHPDLAQVELCLALFVFWVLPPLLYLFYLFFYYTYMHLIVHLYKKFFPPSSLRT